MAKVRAVVTMYTDLEWIGEVPDDVRETDYFEWVKYHVDGGEYSEVGCGDWKLESVEVVDEEDMEVNLDNQFIEICKQWRS